MPSTFTVSSGSGRSGSERVVIYPERTRHSSRSGSVHSPASSDDRSFSSSNDSEGWTEINGYDDGIEPSDSASRAKQTRSRRHTTEARPAPTRRHSSRRLPREDREREREREELPRHTSSHRPREHRHHRAESRRTASDESSSTVASADDYPPSHYGMPPQQRAYPPSGYRHVPAPHAPQPPHSHSGYPPSMTGAPGYPPDPFQAQAQALVHMPHPGQDAFGYPSNNPFSPGAGPANNPFSPMGAPGTPGYFPDPHAPPPMQPHMAQHQQRPQGHSHRGSMYALNSTGYPGSEMVPSPYQHPGMQGMYHGYPMQAYQQMPYVYPPPQSTSPPPAPAEEKKKEPEPKEVVVEKKDDSATKEIEALRQLIKKHEEERIAREQAIILKAEADKAAAAAEKRKQEEIAAASAAAKAAAEKAADEVAKKAKEEHDAKLKEAEEAFKKAKEESDKKLANAEKAKEAEEKKKKELEDEIAKNKPLPDMLCAPIKFKDAVGRKFSFPWHLCKTWKGMEGLIKQAFLHVDLIGKHVQDGHYDLTGPDGEIILPQVWDTMIKPDWEVSMHMWPMPEPEKPSKKDRLAEDAAAAAAGLDMLPDPFAGIALNDLIGLDPGQAAAPAKKGSKKDKKAKRASAVVEVPPMMSTGQQMMPPPPNFPPGLDAILNFPPGPMAPVVVMDEKKAKPKAKPKAKDIGPFAAWIAGSSGSRSSKKR